jgi:DNA-binding CsgD family transcriptional regulator
MTDAGQRRSGDDPFLTNIFSELTAKQLEVLALLADHRTSKEIAADLSISQSAVNQRIEAVRARAGPKPRAELARLYRRHLEQAAASQANQDCAAPGRDASATHRPSEHPSARHRHPRTYTTLERAFVAVGGLAILLTAARGTIGIIHALSTLF